MIKAVIFDFDGVLVKTDILNERVIREISIGYSISFPSEDYRKFFAGKTFREGLKEFLKYHKKEDILNEFMEKKKELFDLQYESKVSLYKGGINLIKELYRKYRLVIVSGTRRILLDKAFAKFKLDEYFEFSLSAEDYKNGKPHPEPYKLALEKLNLTPMETVVVEDSPAGIVSAKNAGIKVIAISHTHDISDLHIADMVIDSLSYQQILNYLDNN